MTYFPTSATTESNRAAIGNLRFYAWIRTRQVELMHRHVFGREIVGLDERHLRDIGLIWQDFERLGSRHGSYGQWQVSESHTITDRCDTAWRLRARCGHSKCRRLGVKKGSLNDGNLVVMALNADVRKGGVRGRAVPMRLSGRDDDQIARFNNVLTIAVSNNAAT